MGDNGEEVHKGTELSEERLRQFEDQSSKIGISASLSNKTTRPLEVDAKVFILKSDFKDRVAKDGLGNDLNGNSKPGTSDYLPNLQQLLKIDGVKAFPLAQPLKK